MSIEVRTQAELDNALESPAARDGDELIVLIGDGRFAVSQGSPRVGAPVFEVDIDGEPVETAEAKA